MNADRAKQIVAAWGRAAPQWRREYGPEMRVFLPPKISFAQYMAAPTEPDLGVDIVTFRAHPVSDLPGGPAVALVVECEGLQVGLYPLTSEIRPTE